MIEESYVTFDTAKLLKEAGFDVPCKSYYELEDGEEVIKDSISPYDYSGFGDTICSCPTLALAAKWLRGKYRFHVYCLQTNLPLTEPKTDKWEWGYIIARIDDPNEEAAYDMNFPNYEAALEAGIVKCLEFLRF